MGSLDKAIWRKEATADLPGHDGVYYFFEENWEDRTLTVYGVRGRITIPFEDLPELSERLMKFTNTV